MLRRKFFETVLAGGLVPLLGNMPIRKPELEPKLLGLCNDGVFCWSRGGCEVVINYISIWTDADGGFESTHECSMGCNFGDGYMEVQGILPLRFRRNGWELVVKETGCNPDETWPKYEVCLDSIDDEKL